MKKVVFKKGDWVRVKRSPYLGLGDGSVVQIKSLGKNEGCYLELTYPDGTTSELLFFFEELEYSARNLFDEDI